MHCTANVVLSPFAGLLVLLVYLRCWIIVCYLLQYSKALRVSVPWLQANPEKAEALKPMLSVVFKRAFELRATHGGGAKGA